MCEPSPGGKRPQGRSAVDASACPGFGGPVRSDDPSTLLFADRWATAAAAGDLAPTETEDSETDDRERRARVRSGCSPTRCRAGADRSAEEQDPGARRRHGNDDPAAHLQRGRVPRRAVRRLGSGPQGQQRSAVADPAGGDQRDPPRLPAGRFRPDRDQHLQRAADLAGRLRHGVAGLRAELRIRPARPCRLRRRRGRGSGPAAIRRRRARTDQPDRVDLTGRQRPGCPERHLSPSSSRPTWSRRTDWSTAAPTCC